MSELLGSIDGSTTAGNVGVRAPRIPTPPGRPGVDPIPDESRTDADPLVSVVVPAYNEEANLEAALGNLVTALRLLVESYEIVVVDDGSDDETGAILEALDDRWPSLEVVHHETNHGKGRALQTGARPVRGRYVMFLDSDGDLEASELAVFFERMRREDADIVVGSKRHPDSDVDYPIKRRFLSWGYSVINRVLFGFQVKDTQVGMKLLRRSVLDEVLPLLLVKEYAFDVELLAVAVDRGYSVTEAPIVLEFNGGSDVDWGAIARIAWDTAAVFYRLHVLGYYDSVDGGGESREMDSSGADDGWKGTERGGPNP